MLQNFLISLLIFTFAAYSHISCKRWRTKRSRACRRRVQDNITSYNCVESTWKHLCIGSYRFTFYSFTSYSFMLQLYASSGSAARGAAVLRQPAMQRVAIIKLFLLIFSFPLYFLLDKYAFKYFVSSSYPVMPVFVGSTAFRPCIMICENSKY